MAEIREVVVRHTKPTAPSSVTAGDTVGWPAEVACALPLVFTRSWGEMCSFLPASYSFCEEHDVVRRFRDLIETGRDWVRLGWRSLSQFPIRNSSPQRWKE